MPPACKATTLRKRAGGSAPVSSLSFNECILEIAPARAAESNREITRGVYGGQVFPLLGRGGRGSLRGIKAWLETP